MAMKVRRRGSELMAYNRHRPCPKCEHYGITDRHHRAIVPWQPEHIQRMCQNCRYVWRERPVS